MKKSIVHFSVVVFTLICCTQGFSQEGIVEKMRFTHDFNIIGLKTEKQAAWVDSIAQTLPQVISCYTDFKTSHTKIVVHEGFNSQERIRNLVVKLGFDLDPSSYTSKYDGQQ